MLLIILSDDSKRRRPSRDSIHFRPPLFSIEFPERVLLFDAKRQTVSAEFKIYNKDTEEEFDIFSSHGGALAHIVSIVLKVVISKLLGLEECLIFDESATFIDDINQVRFAEFLRKISHQLEIQIIFITHIKAFIAASDKVIEVKQKNGVSYVEKEEA